MSLLLHTASKSAADVLQVNTWGYGCAVDSDTLRRYLEVEQFIHLQQKYGGKCLTGKDRDFFYRKAKALSGATTFEPSTTSYDGKLTQWYFENPSCIPLPYYVSYCKSLMCDLELTETRAQAITRLCDINLEVMVAAGACALGLRASAVRNLVTEQGCDLSLPGSVTSEQCDLAVKAVAAANSGCAIDTDALKTYIKNL